MDRTPRICVSAGHGIGSRRPGVEDPGASVVGMRDNTESDVVLAMAKDLYADFKVLFDGTGGYVMLRDKGHYSQSNNEAAAAACDVALDIHLNSGGGTGTEVLYRDGKDKLFASAMSASIAESLGLRDRGAKYRSDLDFLNGPYPGVFVIVELWFADNKYDLAKHRLRRDKELLAIENTCLAHWGWKEIPYRTRPSEWSAWRRRTWKRY